MDDRHWTTMYVSLGKWSFREQTELDAIVSGLARENEYTYVGVEMPYVWSQVKYVLYTVAQSTGKPLSI